MPKRISNILMLLLVALACHAQQRQYEYWIDGNYAGRQSGLGTSELSFSVDMSRERSGIHYLNVRTRNAGGTWGCVNRYLFVVPGMSQAAAKDYEYWLDGDYANRKNSGGGLTAGDIMLSADVSKLPQGIHYFNIRCRDNDGKWGPVNRYMFCVTEKLTIAGIEYWMDSDSLNAAKLPLANDSIVTFNLSVATLGSGPHTLWARLQDSNGKWTDRYGFDFTIESRKDTASHVAVRSEYYYDTDPGYGKGIVLQADAKDSTHFVLSIAGLTTGAHILYVRSADEGGKWSSTVARPLLVKAVDRPNFSRIEYFFDDADPGAGLASVLPCEAEVLGEHLCELPIDGLKQGAHNISVRAQRYDGRWTTAITRPFYIMQHQLADSLIEYFFDRDPGYGKGIRYQNPLKGENTIAIDLGSLSVGAHVLYVRSRNTLGQWSATVSRPLYVCRTPGLVSLEYYFDQGDPGRGKATPVVLPEDRTQPFVFEISLGNLPIGEHTLWLRAKGSDGRWTVIARENFELTPDNSGIQSPTEGNTPKAIFTLSGYKTDHRQKGINIIGKKKIITKQQKTKQQ